MEPAPLVRAWPAAQRGAGNKGQGRRRPAWRSFGCLGEAGDCGGRGAAGGGGGRGGGAEETGWLWLPSGPLCGCPDDAPRRPREARTLSISGTQGGSETTFTQTNDDAWGDRVSVPGGGDSGNRTWKDVSDQRERDLPASPARVGGSAARRRPQPVREPGDQPEASAGPSGWSRVRGRRSAGASPPPGLAQGGLPAGPRTLSCPRAGAGRAARLVRTRVLRASAPPAASAHVRPPYRLRPQTVAAGARAATSTADFQEAHPVHDTGHYRVFSNRESGERDVARTDGRTVGRGEPSPFPPTPTAGRAQRSAPGSPRGLRESHRTVTRRQPGAARGSHRGRGRGGRQRPSCRSYRDAGRQQPCQPRGQIWHPCVPAGTRSAHGLPAAWPLRRESPQERLRSKSPQEIERTPNHLWRDPTG